MFPESNPTQIEKRPARRNRVVEAYQRQPAWLAFLLSAIIAGALALIAGIAASIAGMYLYDGANSRGNDFAIGLHAAGTFVMVIVFSWLRNLHHKITRRTPDFTLYFCLSLAAATTLLSAADLDSYYMGFVLAG